MLTILISIICAGVAGYYTCISGEEAPHYVLAGFAAFGAFLVPFFLLNLWIRKKMMNVMTDIQTDILEAQGNIQKKANFFQSRGQVGPKYQAQLEQEMAAAIRANIDKLTLIENLKWWNILAKKQADTIRGQFLFQIKDYKAAAPCLDKAIITEPILAAMQMVIYYKNNETAKLEKAFQKGVLRFRYEKGLIIYALYSWILVKAKKYDEAMKVLTEAKGKMDNPVIAANCAALANNKPQLFNNGPLGDIWYALNLEVPNMQRVNPRHSKF